MGEEVSEHILCRNRVSYRNIGFEISEEGGNKIRIWIDIGKCNKSEVFDWL